MPLGRKEDHDEQVDEAQTIYRLPISDFSKIVVGSENYVGENTSQHCEPRERQKERFGFLAIWRLWDQLCTVGLLRANQIHTLPSNLLSSTLQISSEFKSSHCSIRKFNLRSIIQHLVTGCSPPSLLWSASGTKLLSTMPGTIQVSVLDFMGLQSSTPPLLLCLKVSMGKREYQTCDKGDFSFPLTTLRDNLIVTLQDAEGNTISHTGVETRLVVEKGIWLDSFPLEGGGYVHMKLQFVLSEDERQRIRIMRESAFKKKHGEILNSSQGSATTVGSEVSSSLSLDHQVPAVSGKEVASHAGLEEVAAGLVSVPFSQDPKSGAENIKEFYPDQKQINPNDTDRNEETSSTNPVSRGTEVHLTEFSPKKVEAQKSLADVPVRTTCAEETSSLLGSSDSVIAAKGNSLPMKLEEDGAHNPGKQGPLEKTPSNVRKMISAFESGLAQDTRPRIKPPPTKSQSRKIAMESHLEDSSLNEVDMEKDKPEKPISETVKEPFLMGELQQTSTNKASSWVESSHDTGQLELRAENFQTKGRNSNSKNKSKVVHSEVDTKKDNKFPEDLIRTSAAKTATVLGRLFDEHSGRRQPCTYIIDGQDSGGKLEESGSRTSPEDSQEVNIGGASNNRLKSETCWEDKNYSFQRSAPWIFPDEARRLCVTTGSKLLMDLMGDCRNEEKNYQGQTSLLPTENTEEHRVHGGTINEECQVPKSSHKLRRSRLENSADDETSTGLVRQVIKVAIMVGFGTLVLFTRQRKSR